MSKIKKIPVDQLGVIIYDKHVGAFFGERKIKKQQAYDAIKKSFNPTSEPYKRLEKQAERIFERELENKLLNDLKKKSGKFGCFNQVDQLSKGERKKLRKTVEEELEAFKNSDFPIALDKFIRIEETIFEKHNSGVKKYPKLKRLHDYIKEYAISVIDLKDYKIIPNDFEVQQSLEIPKDLKDETNNFELMQGEKVSIDHNRIKDELMKLLLEHIQNSYSLSSIYARLNRLEFSMVAVDQIEFCEGSKTIFDYIFKQSDLKSLIDLFTNEMIPILYTTRKLAFSNENLETFEEFEKRILEDYSFSIQEQKLKENIQTLFELLMYVRNQEKERERFNTFQNNNFYYESETMTNQELDFKYQNIKQDSRVIVQEISLIPDGKDIASELNWNECYAPYHGNLLNFLISNEIFLNDSFLISMDQSIIKLDHLNDTILQFDQLTTEQISTYILKYCVFKPESKNLLIDQLKSFSSTKFDNELNEIVSFYIDILFYIPSFSLRLWILKEILLTSFDNTDKEDIIDAYSFCIESRDTNIIKDEFCRLGAILGYENWYKNSFSRTNLNLSSNLITKSNNTSMTGGGITFNDDDKDLENDNELLELETSINNKDAHNDVTEEISNDNINESIQENNKFEENNDFQKNHILQIANDYKSAMSSTNANKFIANQFFAVIPRVSADLYDEDIHFLLELIQNADDNSYEDDKVPTVHFNLFNDKIIIGNNETGFTQKNIKAICRVAKSTKVGSDRKGFIGKKGIGFKSVFKVSSTPEVHSNGYHIAFDITNDDKAGYVCPIWLDEIDENVSLIQKNNNTVIKIPFKTEKDKKERKTVKRDIKNLEVTILLFLNKLRRIIIQDDDEKRIITRKDHEDGKMVEIIETYGSKTTKTRWFKVERTYEIPISLQKRDEGKKEKYVQTHTMISIVFPLENIHSDNWDIKDVSNECCNFPVFAYLPTKYKPNFNFIIQADFNLQSSREFILKDDKMNQWIKEQIPDLFYTAIQEIQEHPRDGSWIQSLNRLIPYIPYSSPTGQFLSKLPHDIANKLSNLEWLINYDEQRCKTNEILYLTEEQKKVKTFLSNQSIFEFLPNKTLYNCIGKYWIHPDVNLSDQHTKNLKFEKFTPSYFESILKNYLLNEENFDLSWIYEFIILSFQLLKHFKGALIDFLNSIQWIPIFGQDQLMSRKQLRTVILLDSSSIYNKYRSALLPNIQFIDVSKIPKDLFNSMKDIFIDLDIHFCESFSDFISKCIIPSYEEILKLPNCSNSLNPIDLSDDLDLLKLIQHYFDFFKTSEFLSHWKDLTDEKNKFLFQKLQNSILLPISNHKNTVVRLKNVHVHYKVNGDKNECPNLDEWYFISISKNNKQFLLFLQKLGCTYGPKIIKSTETLKNESDELNYLFKLQLNTSTSKKIKKQITKYIIQAFFENPYGMDLDYNDNVIGNSSKPGTILKLLRKSKWIFCDNHDSCHLPNEFIWHSKETINFFGQNICVTGENWDKNTIKKLNIREKITCEDSIRYIHHLSTKYEQDQNENGIIKIHESEYIQLQKVYKFLIDNESRKNTDLNKKKWIFIPDTKVKFNEMKSKSEFYYGSFWFSEYCFRLFGHGHEQLSDILEKWGRINLQHYHDFNAFSKLARFNYYDPRTFSMVFNSIYKERKPSELCEQVWVFFGQQFGDINNTQRDVFINEITAPMIPVYGNDSSSIIWKSYTNDVPFYYIDTLDTLDYLDKALTLKQSIQIIYPPNNFFEDSYTFSQRYFLVEILKAKPLSSVITSEIKVEEIEREYDLTLFTLFNSINRKRDFFTAVELFIRFTLKTTLNANTDIYFFQNNLPEPVRIGIMSKEKKKEEDALKKYSTFFSIVKFYKCDHISKIVTILGENFEMDADVALDEHNPAIYRKKTVTEDVIKGGVVTELVRFFAPAFYNIIHRNKFLEILSNKEFHARAEIEKLFEHHPIPKITWKLPSKRLYMDKIIKIVDRDIENEHTFEDLYDEKLEDEEEKKYYVAGTDVPETNENENEPDDKVKLVKKYINTYPENSRPLNSGKTDLNSSPFSEVQIIDTITPQLNNIKKNTSTQNTSTQNTSSTQNTTNSNGVHPQDSHIDDNLSPNTSKNDSQNTSSDIKENKSSEIKESTSSDIMEKTSSDIKKNISSDIKENTSFNLINSEHREHFKNEVVCIKPELVTLGFTFDEFQVPSYCKNITNSVIAEALVYKYLEEKFPDAEIVWQNGTNESKLPFDITITVDGEIRYIEVKSTTSNTNNNSFYISSQELKFCTSSQQMYSVYRVFGMASGENPKISILDDLKSKLDANQVKIMIHHGNINSEN